MDAFFRLIIHLPLLILLFQASHSDTLVGNGVAEWRKPSVYHVEGSIEGIKVGTRVSPPLPEDMAFSPLAAPTPTPGGVVSTSPDYTWPFHSKQVNSPTSPPTNSPPAIPSADASEGMPFINSNPTLPLPTGEADSVTIRPLPTSAHQPQMEAVFPLQIVACFVVWLMLY